jgi:hypothetical protein
MAEDLRIVEFEVFMAVTVKCPIFLNLTPCSPVVSEEPAASIFRAEL